MLLVVFLVVGTASVNATENKKEYFCDGYITIDKEFGLEPADSVISVVVTNDGVDWMNEWQWQVGDGDAVMFFDTYALESGKKIQINFKLEKSGVYNCYIASKALGVEKSKLMFINADRNRELITDILHVTDANVLKSVLERNNCLADLGVFAFKNDDSAINIEGISQLLFSEVESKANMDMEEMRMVVEKAIITTMINEKKLNSFHNINNLKLLEQRIFDYCSKRIERKVIERLEANNINSVELFDKVLLEQTILQLVNENDGADVLKSAFEEYSIDLGITKTITIGLCEKILNSGRFNNINDLISFINKYKENDDPDKQPSSSGGGGGGAGIGSSSNNYNEKTVVSNETYEQKPKELAVFDDISTVEWAVDAITALFKKNIINGKSERLFFPTDSVTREEFTKILMKAFNVNLIDDEFPFVDVSEDDWSYDYIKTAYLAGVVKGVEANRFGKELNISRQDLCVMVYRILEMSNRVQSKTNDISKFGDHKKIADYAIEAVSFLNINGIVDGDENTNFRPEADASRAEAVKIVYKAMTLFDKTEKHESQKGV